jgi:hypothetical protein
LVRLGLAPSPRRRKAPPSKASHRKKK